MAIEAPVRQSIPRWYWLAYLSGGFGLALASMNSFLVPLRAAELDINIGFIGVLLGVRGAVEAVASMPIGGLIDRIGPRTAYIIGTAGSAIVAVLLASASSVAVFLLLQAAVGVLRPLGWVGSQSYVSGLRDGLDQAQDTGRFSFVATAAQIVAPLLVGFGGEAFGVGRAFYVYAAYCGVFCLVGVFLPRGSDARSAVATTRRGIAEGLRLFTRRRIRVVMFLSGARLWINGAWIAFFPLLMVTSGTSEGTASTVVAAMAVAATILSPTTGRLARHLRVEYLAASSLTCAALGLAIAPAIDSVPGAYISALLVGIGQGISLPALLVLIGNAVPPDQRGLALGLRVSVNQTANAVAPPLMAAVIGLTAASLAFPLAAALGMVLLASGVMTTRGGS